MMCERCDRRTATVWLTVQDVRKAQCQPCAAVGVDLARTFYFDWSVEPIVWSER